ncbi:Pet127-domain-containing protein [Glonium stellatum]|uniref:Pet127-domain-containing protein n=1 Tax=Glonium stellatum TaxID=574774 RepID=A0A8E2F594_9PEZI|nr:Pet127-domain-containing protein [Glonium stellatum]
MRVARPVNPYVCLSCSVRRRTRGEQTRLQSSTALHSNEPNSDTPLAFNGGAHGETTTQPPQSRQSKAKTTAKKPKNKTKETDRDTPFHSNEGKISVEGNSTEPQKSTTPSEDSQSTKRHKKAVELEPPESGRRKESGQQAQKSTAGDSPPPETSAQGAQQNIPNKPKKTKNAKKKVARKSATARDDSQSSGGTKNSSETQNTTPPEVVPPRETASTSPDAKKRPIFPRHVKSRSLRSPGQSIKAFKRIRLRKPRIRYHSSMERDKVVERKYSASTKSSWEEGTLTLKEALTGRRANGKTLANIERLSPNDLQFQPLEVQIPPVPMLTHGLDRVLFNPGVYHLQDPRSRVYNFNPYLEKIMPATEFDYDALSKYMTSSKDKSLINMAKEIGAKYTGSTSSMSGTLVHFHYLLSQWRPLNLKMLSKEFPEISNNFSKIQRAPTAIFLRWKDGTYAIDADKEYDSPNIMSWLGQSMEKLLTNSTDEFERYRKSNPEEAPREDDSAPKSFHYSKQGNVLMRSQLDAYDPRLPGTGIFDLKTRAVVSVRMDSAEYEQRSGYQIRYTRGQWESYEREYFDMARATMLKYSLQVRMGRMDGIFVAYHNVERIFGFQYISLPDMDLTLHGQSDTCLGDQEFKMSIELLSKILEKATTKFPEQSIRLHFETRETNIPFMYIFAEPVTEEQADETQNKGAEQMLEFERSIGLNSSGIIPEKEREEWENIKAQVEAETEQDQIADGAKVKDDKNPSNSISNPNRAPAESNLPADEFLNKNGLGAVYDTNIEKATPQHKDLAKEDPAWGLHIREEEISKWVATENTAKDMNPAPTGLLGNTKTTSEAEKSPLDTTLGTILDSDNATTTIDQPTERTPILGFTLTIRNRVNGQYVIRPENLTPDDTWSLEYSLDEIAQTNNRDMRIYAQVKYRRASELDFDKREKDSDFDQYRKLLMKYSEQGRDWRKKQDKIDASIGVKVYRPLGDDAEEVIGQYGPSAMEEKISGVNDYLTWLYKNARTNVQLTKPQAVQNNEEVIDDVNDYLGWLYENNTHEI